MSGIEVLGINHVGLAPKDSARARWFFETVLGLPFLGSELVLSQKTNTHMLESNNQIISSKPRLEILESDGTDPEAPIAKFLAKRGAGIHHIAMQVANIDAALERLKSYNVRMIDNQPRIGAHKTRIAFVHPESTGGLLVELVQEG